MASRAARNAGEYFISGAATALGVAAGGVLAATGHTREAVRPRPPAELGDYLDSWSPPEPASRPSDQRTIEGYLGEMAHQLWS